MEVAVLSQCSHGKRDVRSCAAHQVLERPNQATVWVFVVVDLVRWFVVVVERLGLLRDSHRDFNRVHVLAAELFDHLVEVPSLPESEDLARHEIHFNAE